MRRAAASLGQSLLINVLGPYAIYRLSAPQFTPDSTAPLLLSALPPAIFLGYGLARKRALDVIAVISLVQLTLGVVITLTALTARAALLGHALQPGALAVVFALSAAVGHPLVQPLARQLTAGGDAALQAEFDAKARRPPVRATFVRLTLGWAAGLCLQSAFLAQGALAWPADTYLLVSPMVTYGGFALMAWASFRYARRRAAPAAGDIGQRG